MFTIQQHTLLHRQGYVIFDLMPPSELMDQIKADMIEEMVSAPIEVQNTYERTRRIPDLWRKSRAVVELARLGLPWVKAAFYGDLSARRPFCFQTLNFFAGTEQAVHSDTVHFNCVPSGWMCGLWVALEDVHPDAGPLVVYPDSHSYANLTFRDFNARTYQEYEEGIRRVCQTEPFERPAMQRGQAMLWLSNLLHGGSPVRDRRRTRYSQVSHYFFTGCKYYTANGQDPAESILWRDVEEVH